MQLPLVIQVLSFATIPALALVIAAVIPSFVRLGSQAKGMIQHFAAGVVFSVATVEFLPEVRHDLTPLPLAITFLAGVALMLSLEKVVATVRRWLGRSSSVGSGFMSAVAVDLFLDGLLLGVGFSVGAKEGLLLAAALAIEAVTMGLAIASHLQEAGAATWQQGWKAAACAALLLAGAGLGGTTLHALDKRTLAMMMSFGLAALLYLVTEELLVEAHQEVDTPIVSAMFFLGFLVFLVLGMLA